MRDEDLGFAITTTSCALSKDACDKLNSAVAYIDGVLVIFPVQQMAAPIMDPIMSKKPRMSTPTVPYVRSKPCLSGC